MLATSATQLCNRIYYLHYSRVMLYLLKLPYYNDLRRTVRAFCSPAEMLLVFSNAPTRMFGLMLAVTLNYCHFLS